MHCTISTPKTHVKPQIYIPAIQYTEKSYLCAEPNASENYYTDTDLLTIFESVSS